MNSRKAVVHALLVLLGISSVVLVFRDKPWNATRILGIIVLIPSSALWALARLQLGRSFAVRAQARELVTHGLYSRIRNPIYLFGSLGILGIILYAGHPRFLWVFVLLVPLQLFRIRREEKVLQEKFGEAYLEYKKRTWF
jgi:protein-S-isoprenylcysteine O-methyltransferase Ste14